LASEIQASLPEKKPPKALALVESEQKAAEPELEDTPPDDSYIPEAASKSTTDERIPLLRELSTEMQERLQKLDISGHVYSEDPSKCFVFINSQSYRVGDRIGENGFLLEKITPEGVIIYYGSGRARLLLGK
jgi:hypothetical protein